MPPCGWPPTTLITGTDVRRASPLFFSPLGSEPESSVVVAAVSAVAVVAVVESSSPPPLKAKKRPTITASVTSRAAILVPFDCIDPPSRSYFGVVAAGWSAPVWSSEGESIDWLEPPKTSRITTTRPMTRPRTMPIARSVQLIAKEASRSAPRSRQVRRDQAGSGGPRFESDAAISRPPAAVRRPRSGRGATALTGRRRGRRAASAPSRSTPGALPVTRTGIRSSASGASASTPPATAIATASGSAATRNAAAAGRRWGLEGLTGPEPYRCDLLCGVGAGPGWHSDAVEEAPVRREGVLGGGDHRILVGRARDQLLEQLTALGGVLDVAAAMDGEVRVPTSESTP